MSFRNPHPYPCLQKYLLILWKSLNWINVYNLYSISMYRVLSALIGLLRTLQTQMYQYYDCLCRIHYSAVFCFASAVIYLLSALRARYDLTPKNWLRIELTASRVITLIHTFWTSIFTKYLGSFASRIDNTTRYLCNR